MRSGETPRVQIYTDGGCDPNPGPGGWGAVLISGSGTKEMSGADAATTNNRMEITATISALRALQGPCRVTIYTDSQYLCKGVTEWLPGWLARGWRRANGRPVENADLWQELWQALKRHAVEWHWVKGHRGHPPNERADQLATRARQKLLSGEPVGKGQRGKRAHDGGPPLPRIEIYTRGCALGTPGPGGYAAVLVDESDRVRIVSGSRAQATNNMMELWAAVAALQSLRQVSRARLHTISKYVHDGATRWLGLWERRNWLTRGGQPVKNREIWLELSRVMGDHDVIWTFLGRGQRNSHCQKAGRVARWEAERIRSKRAQHHNEISP